MICLGGTREMYLVNKEQSPAERRLKYALCISLGDDTGNATRRRDWRWNKIARVHGYTSFRNLVGTFAPYLAKAVPNYNRKNGAYLEDSKGGKAADNNNSI